MNPTAHPSTAMGAAPSAGLTVDDVLFMVFRQKWLILAFVCLGVAGAAVIRVKRPPLFVSTAKLMVHYVTEPHTANPGAAQNQDVRSTDAGAQAIILAEVEILTSIDVVTNAVAMVGPEKILAKKGGGRDPVAAAGVVAAGLEVDPPRAPMIDVSLKHLDQDVAQAVLGALIETYKNKHVEVYQGRLEEYYAQRLEESRHKLSQLEQELKQLRTQANVPFMDDPKTTYQNQIEKKTEELWDAEREVAERKAVIAAVVPRSAMTNAEPAPEMVPPADKLSEYAGVMEELENARKNERDLLRVFTELSPMVQPVHAQVEKLAARRAALEKAFPALMQSNPGGSRGSTNGTGLDLASELTELKRLEARLVALRTVLSNLQFSAAQVLELDPKITELQRQHDEEQKRYEFFVASLEESRRGESKAIATANNISVVQTPTPSGLDSKKTMKMMGMVFGGCVGFGLGLAFLMEQFFDRSIKRPVDVERRLRMPLLLTIPQTAWKNGQAISRWLGWRGDEAPAGGGPAAEAQAGAIALWQPSPELRSYAEGLRERLMTYFEVHDLNLKKPKLVAVTGCESNSDVSTLAGGLAAVLSETGAGDVLLVNMHSNNGVTQPFHAGKPSAGLADVLEPEGRADAQVQENLYLATLQKEGPNAKLAMALSKQFHHLVPKLKASDYDYIIFDMPPVTPSTMTARLASHMDITLLVLEAEQTSQQAAARATALMREAKANVAAVLNKYQPHVPERLAQEP